MVCDPRRESELSHRESASALFPGAAGAGVRIAVIDSGVHDAHPHLLTTVAGGVSIDAEGRGLEPDFTDRIGHGTAVMAAIQEKAPAAEYLAVKVFHNSLRTTVESLIAAIEWCIAKRADIVNMSLGTTNQAHAGRLAGMVHAANSAGVLISAARHVGRAACYPGCLHGVLSVVLDRRCPRDRCRYELREGAPIFAASGYPRPIPGVPPLLNLNGISFAVANMSGFAARAREVQNRLGASGEPPSRTVELLAAESTSRGGGFTEL